MKKKILKEEDLANMAAPEPKEQPIQLDSVDIGTTPPEETPEENIGELDYQYTLEIGKQEKEEPGQMTKEFTFYVKKKESEQPEEDNELQEVEDTSNQISQEQSPPQSTEPVPQVKESVNRLVEAENQELQATEEPQAVPDAEAPTPDATEPDLENTEELEEDPAAGGVEFKEEDLKKFMDSVEAKPEFFINEKTKFTFEEAIDYLKLYPDSDIYMKVENPEEFDTKMSDFQNKTDEVQQDVENEEQNVQVDEEGAAVNLNQANQTVPETPGGIKRESFSIFNIKNSEKFPDGVYLANLSESIMYGKLADIKVTKNSIILEKVKFSLSNELDTAKVMEMEEIPITILESSDVDKLLKLLENSEIKFKL